MTNQLRVASVLLLMSLVVVNQAQSWDYEKQRTLTEMITLRREINGQRHPIFSGSEAGEFALNNRAVTSRVKEEDRYGKSEEDEIDLKNLLSESGFVGNSIEQAIRNGVISV
jgi:hypothetical protein